MPDPAFDFRSIDRLAVTLTHGVEHCNVEEVGVTRPKVRPLYPTYTQSSVAQATQKLTTEESEEKREGEFLRALVVVLAS